MGFLNTVLGWARNAWNLIAGIPGDIGNALNHLWNFIGSLHTLVDHLFSVVSAGFDAANLGWLLWGVKSFEALVDAVQRIDGWMKRHHFNPLWAYINRRLAILKAWISFWYTRLWLLELQLYAKARAYAFQLTAAERSQRIQADKLEHAEMLKAVAQALATVQQEAASGYKAGNAQRVSVITRITDALATRNPLVKTLVSDLVRVLLDVIATENPLERAALGFLLTQVINRLGVDRVAGELLGALIGPLAANPNPGNLHDVADDLAKRVSAMEAQWAQYMTDGGPQLDQAGRDWKSLTSLGTDAALLAFFAAAVAAPDAWARDVARVAGPVVNGTIEGTVNLIRRA